MPFFGSSEQSRRHFVGVGMAGEAVNFITLVTGNLLAPRVLSDVGFGRYVTALAPAFIALGLFDAPMSYRLQTCEVGAIRTSVAQKVIISAGGAALISALATHSALGAGASVTIALAYAATSTTIALAYRNSNSITAFFVTVAAAGGLISAITLGAYRGWDGFTIAAAQGTFVFILTAVIYSMSHWPAPFGGAAEADVSVGMLAVPTILGGLTQWGTVLAISIAVGPAAAGAARIATSLASGASSAVPVSGHLVLASARRNDSTAIGTAKLIAAGLGLSLLLATAATIALPLLRTVIDSPSFDSLGAVVPAVLLGGVGFAAVCLCWPLLVTRLIDRATGQRLAVILVIASMVPIAAGFAGSHAALAALAALYLAAGLVVATVTFRNLRGRD